MESEGEPPGNLPYPTPTFPPRAHDSRSFRSRPLSNPEDRPPCASATNENVMRPVISTCELMREEQVAPTRVTASTTLLPYACQPLSLSLSLSLPPSHPRSVQLCPLLGLGKRSTYFSFTA
jgi:hypothetical protein